MQLTDFKDKYNYHECSICDNCKWFAYIGVTCNLTTEPIKPNGTCDKWESEE